MKLLYKEQFGPKRNRKWILNHIITDQEFLNEFFSDKEIELDFLIEYLKKYDVLTSYDGLDFDADYSNVYIIDEETREEILSFQYKGNE